MVSVPCAVNMTTVKWKLNFKLHNVEEEREREAKEQNYIDGEFCVL